MLLRTLPKKSFKSSITEGVHKSKIKIFKLQYNLQVKVKLQLSQGICCQILMLFHTNRSSGSKHGLGFQSDFFLFLVAYFSSYREKAIKALYELA